MKKFINAPAALLVLHGTVAPLVPWVSSATMVPLSLAVGASITVPTLAYASTPPTENGNPFDRHNKTPEDLARKIEASLAKDPTGNSYIDQEGCMTKGNGSCAKPKHYLAMFKHYGAGPGLTDLASLPRYVRSLKMKDAPTGEYQVACLKFSSDKDDHWKPEADCFSRPFHAGEHAWVDPDTGRIMLAEDCTNPVGAPVVKQACAYLNFYANVEQGDTSARLKEYGPTDLADETVCSPALRLAGDTTWQNPFVEKCPSVWCNFEADDARIPEQGWRTGSFRLRRSGMYTLRLPLKVAKELAASQGLNAEGKQHSYRIVFCIEKTADPGPTMAQYQGLVSEAHSLQAEERSMGFNEEGLPSAYGRVMNPDMYNPHALAQGLYTSDDPSVQKLNDRVLDYDQRAKQWNLEATAWNTLHSCAMGVKWFNYIDQPDGSKVATIFYTQRDAEAAHAKDALGRDTILWWRWDRMLCQ